MELAGKLTVKGLYGPSVNTTDPYYPYQIIYISKNVNGSYSVGVNSHDDAFTGVGEFYRFVECFRIQIPLGYYKKSLTWEATKALEKKDAFWLRESILANPSRTEMVVDYENNAIFVTSGSAKYIRFMLAMLYYPNWVTDMTKYFADMGKEINGFGQINDVIDFSNNLVKTNKFPVIYLEKPDSDVMDSYISEWTSGGILSDKPLIYPAAAVVTAPATTAPATTAPAAAPAAAPAQEPSTPTPSTPTTGNKNKKIITVVLSIVALMVFMYILSVVSPSSYAIVSQLMKMRRRL
jgi:hypothetical protein